MLWMLPTATFAYAIVAPCRPVSFDASIPPAGAVGVPTDTVLSIGVTVCGSPGGTVSLALQDADGGVLRTADYDTPEVAGVLSLDPGGLAQNTDYVLVATGTSGVAEIPFTTGTGTVAGISGVPEILSIDASARWQDDEFVGGYPVVSATDLDVLSIVTVQDGDEVLGLAPVFSSGDDVYVSVVTTPDERPKEMCVVPGQVDGHGETTVGAEVCLKVRSGCATGAGAPGAGVAGLAALLLGLRRRDR